MYLFGGSNDLTSNNTFFSLDLNTFKWDVVKQKVIGGNDANLPDSADEHTAVLNGD
jgi:N-acetylneuraminic acid mutarotase